MIGIDPWQAFVFADVALIILPASWQVVRSFVNARREDIRCAAEARRIASLRRAVRNF